MIPVTEKNIKEHFECSCGYNSVEDYRDKISHNDLRRSGAKRRVYQNTNEPFYLVYHFTVHQEPHD